jgi:hypothetical protein
VEIHYPTAVRLLRLRYSAYAIRLALPVLDAAPGQSL